MRGSSKVIAVLIVLTLALVAWIVYREWNLRHSNADNVSAVIDFESCAAAGNPVMESFPRQCRDEEGNLYVEDISQDQQPGADDTDSSGEFFSQKGTKIVLDNFESNQTVTSPLNLSGQVPGTWTFEANFPISIIDSSGSILVEQGVMVDGDWMSEEYVPFTTELRFDVPSSGSGGFLILAKDNPSGEEANDDSVRIPVRFQ